MQADEAAPRPGPAPDRRSDTQERRSSRLTAIQAWASIFATIFTGLAVLVSAYSVTIQLTQVRDDERRVQSANASLVGWWIEPGPRYVVNNASSVNIDVVRFDFFPLKDLSKTHKSAAFGQLEPCTRLTATLSTIDSADPYYGVALLFLNSQGFWRNHGSGPEPSDISVLNTPSEPVTIVTMSRDRISGCVG
jgi:hypothetical protein